MGAPSLDRGGETQELRLLKRRDRKDGDERRSSLGQRPGLVHEKDVHLTHRLDRLRVPEQDSHPGASPRRDLDGHRRRQPQRAGTCDDENGDGVHQRIGETRGRSGQRPGDEGDDRDQNHDRDENRRHPVGESLDGSPAPLSLPHHHYDAGEQGIAPDPFRAHHEASGPIQRPPDHARRRPLFDRQGFAGNHGLVHGAHAFEHNPVHGDLLPGADPQAIFDLNFAQRDFLLGTLGAETMRRGRIQAEEHPDGGSRPAPGP